MQFIKISVLIFPAEILALFYGKKKKYKQIQQAK